MFMCLIRFFLNLSFKYYHFIRHNTLECTLPGGSDGKASACNAGDPGSIPGSGRSPGERNGNPLQHSCLENPMDGGATVHGVAKSQTWPSNFTFWSIGRNVFIFTAPFSSLNQIFQGYLSPLSLLSKWEDRQVRTLKNYREEFKSQ